MAASQGTRAPASAGLLHSPPQQGCPTTCWCPLGQQGSCNARVVPTAGATTKQRWREMGGRGGGGLVVGGGEGPRTGNRCTWGRMQGWGWRGGCHTPLGLSVSVHTALLLAVPVGVAVADAVATPVRVADGVCVPLWVGLLVPVAEGVLLPGQEKGEAWRGLPQATAPTASPSTNPSGVQLRGGQ